VLGLAVLDAPAHAVGLHGLGVVGLQLAQSLTGEDVLRAQPPILGNGHDDGVNVRGLFVLVQGERNHIFLPKLLLQKVQIVLRPFAVRVVGGAPILATNKRLRAAG
jgi:hypothetical protein